MATILIHAIKPSSRSMIGNGVLLSARRGREEHSFILTLCNVWILDVID